jgi:hypothetical protein
MQKQAFVLRLDVEELYTHLAGGPRWDVGDPHLSGRCHGDVHWRSNKAFAETQACLYLDEAKFNAEEARRFTSLEDRWTSL